MKLHLLWIATALACVLTNGTANAQRLHVYAEPKYHGAERMFLGSQPDLQATHPTTIASVRVIRDRWLLCTSPDFTGDCAWLAHDVSSLPELGFTNAPGSLRPERVPTIMRNWGERRPPPRADLVLFDKASYDGDWTALKDSVPDFTAAHLKSPGSIVINEGTWRLCTGIGYAGRCLVANGSAWDMGAIFAGRILSAKRLQ